MPTTKTITIYKFEELDQKAKNRAYERWLENDPYGWADEDRKTLKAFCEVFPVKVTDWSYDACSYHIRCRMNYDYLPEAVPTLSGWRLATYIWNNYGDELWKGKYYGKGRYENGKYIHKFRHSKVILGNCCVLTGYCIDEDILEPVYDFLKRPDNTTFEDLMQRCCEAWAKACSNSMEADTTMEAFAEFCEANDMMFTVNGGPA